MTTLPYAPYATEVEFSGGLIAKVVGTYSDSPYFIVEYAGQYAACMITESFKEDGAWIIVSEEEAWRDSLIDASCDVDIAMQMEG